jgi:hypothetical protein
MYVNLSIHRHGHLFACVFPISAQLPAFYRTARSGYPTSSKGAAGDFAAGINIA